MIASQRARKTHVIAFAGNVDNIKGKDENEKKSRSGTAAQRTAAEEEAGKQRPNNSKQHSAAAQQTHPAPRPLLSSFPSY